MKKLGLVTMAAVAAITLNAASVSAGGGYPPVPPPGGGGGGGGGTLPATGSDSAPNLQIASGLVAVGAGLAIVGGIRRRKSLAN